MQELVEIAEERQVELPALVYEARPVSAALLRCQPSMPFSKICEYQSKPLPWQVYQSLASHSHFEDLCSENICVRLCEVSYSNVNRQAPYFLRDSRI